MSSSARVDTALTLEEFLRLPEIDEHPYLEYIDGRIEAKPDLGARANLLRARLIRALDLFAEPHGLGDAFLSLRCNFAGRSAVSHIAFLLDSHIEVDERGEIADETRIPPDLSVELTSPDERSDQRPRERLRFATSHGASLGWLIDPDQETVDVFRPGHPPARLPDDGILEGDPVLPGYRLPVVELFGWQKLRRSNPKPSSPRTESTEPGESS